MAVSHVLDCATAAAGAHPPMDGAEPLNRGLQIRTAVACAGAPSPLRRWAPHVKCRTCALYRVIGSPVVAPEMNRKGECPNWRSE